MWEWGVWWAARRRQRDIYACLLALVSVERPQLVVFTEALLGLLVGPLDLVVPRERHLWVVGCGTNGNWEAVCGVGKNCEALPW